MPTGAVFKNNKLLAGDICPFAIPALRLALDKGDAFEAIRTIAELCALLTQFHQLPELWLYQVQARDCAQAYLSKQRTSAEADALDKNLLTAAIARLERCDRLYELCRNLGIFTDVAYDQLLQPLGSSWDAAEFPFQKSCALSLPLQKYSTLSARVTGTEIWKRYMRRRIQQFKSEEHVEIVQLVDTRFAIPIQAFCRRLFVQHQNCCLAAAARRALAQEKYKDLPLRFRSGASCIQANVRRFLLLRRYIILRDTCSEHGIEILNDWKKLPAATQLMLYNGLQQGINPSDPELDEFQKFMRQKVEGEGGTHIATRQASALSEQQPPKRQSPPDVPEEPDRPPTQTFRDVRGPNVTGEQLLGRDVHPEVGMRVVFAIEALEEFPELLEDSGGGIGTITWVDPEDADGDGVTGDICEVLWEKTGLKGDYRTGFEGSFRLALVVSKRVRAADDDGSEKIIGLDVEPEEGMRVVFCAAALKEFPELIQDSGGTEEDPGVGIITWVDPEDADGDGVIGDICEVKWQKTGITGDYRTGFEGDFRLALFMGNRKRREGQDEDEVLVGLDCLPRLGMRVVLSREALRDFPELLEECGMSSSGVLGAGNITWVDEEDHDGDGHTGDVCEVEWERTGIRAKYDIGLNGNFRLTETVPLLHETSGMKLQKVFRGHRSRRMLRNLLITKYLQEREMEEIYNRFLSALQLQCATRRWQARLRLTFERRLACIYERERSIGPDPHTIVPLRLQSTFRGHASRSKLRSTILSVYMIKNHLMGAWTEERNTRAHIKRAYFILHTRPRILSWQNHKVRMHAHVRYHAIIEEKYKTGVVWHALCYWMQHSLDAKDRVDYVSLLIHNTWKHLVYMRLMRDATDCWRFHTKNALWLDETRHMVAESHKRYLKRLKYDKIADFTLMSRVQRESAFRLRARITFAMCVHLLHEWHICVWRRMVMRNVGDLMLPCWVEFVMWRCFKGLRFNGRKGQIVLSRAEISKITLQQKFASVSKKSQSALIRFTKKRTGVKGPTRPQMQYIEDEVAARAETAITDNDAVYRPMLRSKAFPYPNSSHGSESGTDDRPSRSGVSTPAYVDAGAAMHRPSKKKTKKYLSNEEIEAGFWDARSKVLLQDMSNREMQDYLRMPEELMAYQTTLPDLTRRPVWQTGAEILAEKFGREPRVLSSLQRPSSEGGHILHESRDEAHEKRPERKRMAWETQSFNDGYGEHPDIRQALAVSAGSLVERKRLRESINTRSSMTRSSTALGRLEAGRLPPL